MTSPTPGGRAAVKGAIEERLGVLGWSPRRLSEEAGLGPNAVSEFLSGKRSWPRPATWRAIEKALGWGEGSVTRMAAQVTTTSTVSKTDGLGDDPFTPGEHVVLDLPPGTNAGYSRSQVAEALAHAKAEYLRRLREMGLRDGDEGDGWGV